MPFRASATNNPTKKAHSQASHPTSQDTKMSSKARERRDQAEIDLQCQVDRLDREVDKQPGSYRKIRLEMNKAEEKMQNLKNAHAGYCKSSSILPSSTESLNYILPLCATHEAKMDKAQEALDAHEDARGEEAQEDMENELAQVKCDVECKLKYFNKVKENNINPQTYDAVKRNHTLMETKLGIHNQLIKALLPCLTGEERNTRKREGDTWYNDKREALDTVMAEIDSKAQEAPAPPAAPSTSQSLPRSNSTTAQGASTAAGAATKQLAKFKPMDTPKWDGKCKTFAKFKKQWEEIVQPRIEGTHEHLLLTTEALPKFILDNISTLSTTAEQIWEHLDKKFGNTKIVAKEIMKEVEALDHKKLGKSFMLKFTILINDAYASLNNIDELDWLTSKRATSELEDQLPNEEKAEWAKFQTAHTGDNDFNKFRRFLDHRKEILDAVDAMGARKNLPKVPDKPDPNQKVCDYCGMTRHLEEECRAKQRDYEAGTPGASRGSKGSTRGRGNELDQRGQRNGGRGRGNRRGGADGRSTNNIDADATQGQVTPTEVELNSNHMRPHACNRCKTSSNLQKCNACQKTTPNHCIAHCEKYITLAVDDRVKIIKISHTCAVCLHPSHKTDECKLKESPNYICGMNQSPPPNTPW